MSVEYWWNLYQNKSFLWRLSVASASGAVLLALPAAILDRAMPAAANNTKTIPKASGESVGSVYGGTVNIYNAPITQILSTKESSTVTAQNSPNIFAPGSIISPHGGNNKQFRPSNS